ncbi:MAG TPA: hypothetical protein VKZ84_06360 [Bacteriovoracaceae bacterium]|nr:hypothetical protein [Bacteriovoracaceae bacterium]
MRYLFSLFLLFSYAQASTNVFFADLCSGREIRVATPNGTTLKIEIDEIENDGDLEVMINFRPAGEIPDLRDKSQTISYSFKVKSKYIKAGNYSGFFRIPKKSILEAIEVKNNFYRIWDAEVKWIQSTSGKSGSAVASFYRSPARKSFFQINSASICYWEDQPKISSKLYKNDTHGHMTITRHQVLDSEKTSTRGFSLGFNIQQEGIIPVGALGLNSYGWFFKNWDKQIGSKDLMSIERRYSLFKDEAGLFFTRMSFNRHLVTEYAWSFQEDACGSYLPVSQGYLDVGSITEDFIIVPPHYLADEERLEQHISVMRPSLNSCAGLNSNDITDVITSENDRILYYYEHGSL